MRRSRSKIKEMRLDKCIFTDMSRKMINVTKLFRRINQTNYQDVLHLSLLYPYKKPGVSQL